MTDAATRKLEREVEASGDDASRFNLTRQYIRNKQGTLLWWRTDHKPHLNASRVCLSYTTEDPLSGETKVVDTPGWAVATPSVADLFDFASRARHATAIDLATGKWLTLHGRRSWTETDRARVAELTTSTDALGRPRQVGRAARRSGQQIPDDEIGPGRNWTLPLGPGQIAQRGRDEPIYDSELIDLDQIASQYTLFQNFSSFSTFFRDSPQKQWGEHCNIQGSGGGLPQSYLHESTGVTIELSTLDGRPVSREFVEWFGSSFYVTYRMVHTEVFTIPASLVTTTRPEGTSGDMRIEGIAPPPLYPLMIPVHLKALEHFQVRIASPHRIHAPESLTPRQVVVKVILSGFTWKGFTE